MTLNLKECLDNLDIEVDSNAETTGALKEDAFFFHSTMTLCTGLGTSLLNRTNFPPMTLDFMQAAADPGSGVTVYSSDAIEIS